jgi:aminopeptidase N
MLHRSLLFVFVLSMTVISQVPPVEPGVSHELAKWRAARYSYVRYKLNLTLEKMSPVLKGTMEIRVKVSEPGAVATGSTTPIILDWRRIKGHEGKSTIANVMVNGKAVSVSSNWPPANAGGSDYGEHLIFRDGVVPGENVIKLDFTSPILTSGSAITRYVDKEDGAEYIYSLFVPSDASTAFPVFDQPDLKAKFKLFVSLKNLPARNVVSNTQKLGEFVGRNGIHSVEFAETLPISTYVFSFAAGNFLEYFEPGSEGDKISRTFYDDGSSTVYEPRKSDRRVYVRQSQEQKFKPHAAEVFRLNREGIKFLESYFDYKFPFPKYDIVLIPEFPFGGMEHAGATFLRESSVIFPQEPTKNDYISRANVIFHEAAHQWFGDTVTMKWFDDLWLKEGFAEFMAYKTLEKVMPEYNAWKVFYERNKQAAYLTDSTKGTTPIYQEIANLNAAKSAYGNIVYRKAPSFLKQAEFYISEEKFQAGIRSFIKKYEFSNAGWEDLVLELAGYRNSHVYEFVNPFVTGAGVPVIRFNRDTPAHSSWENNGGHFSVATDAIGYTYSENFKKHKTWGMEVKLLLRYEDDSIVETKRIHAGNGYLMQFPRQFDELGRPKDKFEKPVLIFPNVGDFGYGIFLLDDKSRYYVLKNIQNEKDDFLRTMMWGSLWDSVREAELDPKEYVELVVKNINSEIDESTIQTLLARASIAMTYYLSEPPALPGTAAAGGSQFGAKIEAVLIDGMQNAPTLGQRITFYRAFLNVASTGNARRILREILNSKFQILDLKLKTKDRFDIVTRLLILNDPDAPALLAGLEKTETSDEAKRYAYAAKAGIATADNKAKYWNDFTVNKEISESWIEAAFGPLNSTRHTDLTLPYLERALKELPNHKRNRKIFFVNGWLAAFIGGQRDEKALAIVNKFLADNPNLDKDLRLKILENVDLIERAVKIRSKYGRN